MIAKVEGLAELRRKLATMGNQKTARKINRKAMRSGTAVMTKGIKNAAPVDEGILKKSIANKVAGRGMNITGIIGSDVAKLKQSAATDKTRPTNIDWLTEFGHVAPDGTFVPPSGRMRATASATLPASERKIVEVIKAELEKEAVR